MAEVLLNVENCRHEGYIGEYRSGVWDDSSTLSFFSSNLDNSNPVGFGEDPDEEALYEYYFNIYANESDKKAGEVSFGSGTIFVSTDDSSSEFKVYLTPKGLRWEISKDNEEELREGCSYERLKELDDNSLKYFIYQYSVIDTSDDMPENPKELIDKLWGNLDLDNIAIRRGVTYDHLVDMGQDELLKMAEYLGLDIKDGLGINGLVVEIWDWLYVVRNEDPIPYDYDEDSFVFDTDDVEELKMCGYTWADLQEMSTKELWVLALSYYDGLDKITPKLKSGELVDRDLWYFLRDEVEKVDYLPNMNCWLKDLAKCETDDDFKGWMIDSGMEGDEVSEYTMGTVWLAAREIEHEDWNNWNYRNYRKGLLNEAKEKRKEGAFPESNALLEEFIAWEDKKDTIAEAHQLMGDNYLSLEAYDKVIESHKKAIELGREEYMIYSDLGRSYFTLKNYDEAINAYKRASTLNKGAFYPDYMIARMFLEKKQNKEALNHINIAIERDNLLENSNAADYGLHGLRGDINIKLGDFQNAIQDYERALNLSPNYAFLNFRLGQLYTETKNYEAAYKNFQKAQSLDERMQSDGFIWLLRGHCMYNLKDYIKAVLEYEKAIFFKKEEAEKWKKICYNKLKESGEEFEDKLEKLRTEFDFEFGEPEEPDYLFQYEQNWVLYEMKDAELEEHINNVIMYHDAPEDDNLPTTQQEFWDWLVELNKKGYK